MKEWYIQIDGLRFIAVTAVIIEHFAYGIGSVLHAGYFGVDLFFVISGFLITEGLLKSKGQMGAIRIFYIKRFLRIFPIYYLLLFILLFHEPFRGIAPYAFTYTMNYYPLITGNEPPDGYGHLWSLSLEEQFYIFWPFIILFLNKRILPYAIVGIATVSLVYFSATRDFVTLPGRMFSLGFGAVLAYIKHVKTDFYKSDVRAKGMAVFCLSVIMYFFHQQIAISILSLAIVYAASNNAFNGMPQRILENKRVLYIGKISYGVYLYHLPLSIALTAYLFNPIWNNINFSFLPVLKYHSWIIKLPLYYLITIGVAHLSFIAIEKPLLKLKKSVK